MAQPPSRRENRALESVARDERARITSERARIRERLAQLESEMSVLRSRDSELSERAGLLDQLVSSGAREASVEPVVLRGAELRRRAVSVLAQHRGLQRPIGYRDWYALLQKQGYVVLGKRPLAMFLTTVTRSPLVVRGPEDGSYLLDDSPLVGLKKSLAESRAELVDLEKYLAERPAGDTPLRKHRLDLMASIRRLERQVDESESALDARLGPFLKPVADAA